MKYTLFILSLLIISIVCQSQDYRQIYASDTKTVSIKEILKGETIIVSIKTIEKILKLFDSNTHQWNEFNNGYVLMLCELNCNTNRIKHLEISFFTQQGEFLHKIKEENPKWEIPRQDSDFELFHKYGCAWYGSKN